MLKLTALLLLSALPLALQFELDGRGKERHDRRSCRQG